MEQAVRLIYFLAESPDQLCSRLLQRSAHLLLEQITEGGEPNQSQLQEGGSQCYEEQGNVRTRDVTFSILWNWHELYKNVHKKITLQFKCFRFEYFNVSLCILTDNQINAALVSIRNCNFVYTFMIATVIFLF